MAAIKAETSHARVVSVVVGILTHPGVPLGIDAGDVHLLVRLLLSSLLDILLASSAQSGIILPARLVLPIPDSGDIE